MLVQANAMTLFVATASALLTVHAVAQPTDPPRLILQVTVDQLRGDFPARYYDRFGDGGFRYLMDQGTWYANAHHAHANNETIVGHTTLATGAHPARHGMVANVWFDRESGALTYNIEDGRYPILGSKACAFLATRGPKTADGQ